MNYPRSYSGDSTFSISFNNLIIERPTAAAIFTGTALPICLYTVWSHSANSPWDITTRLSRFKWGMAIPDVYIQSYFANIINVEFASNGCVV